MSDETESDRGSELIEGEEEEEEEEEKEKEKEKEEKRYNDKDEKTIENEESSLLKSSDEEITEEKNGKQTNKNKKRKREKKEKDHHKQHPQKRNKKVKIHDPRETIKDVEMSFDDFESKNDDKSLFSLDTFLADIKEEDKNIKNEVGALEIISRMNMDDKEDLQIAMTVFNTPMNEIQARLSEFDSKFYIKLYDSKAYKTLSFLHFRAYDPYERIHIDHFTRYSRHILAIPVVSILMKTSTSKNYDDSLLSVMKKGKVLIKSFNHLNKCFASLYKKPDNFNFLKMECIEFPQDIVQESLSDIRRKLTDPIEKDLQISLNRQKIPPLNEMSPEQLKAKMNHTMGRLAMIMKAMYGPLFKLKKPGKKDTGPYEFERDEEFAWLCSHLEYGNRYHPRYHQKKEGN